MVVVIPAQSGIFNPPLLEGSGEFPKVTESSRLRFLSVIPAQAGIKWRKSDIHRAPKRNQTFF